MRSYRLKHLLLAVLLTGFFAASDITADDRFISDDNEGFCVSLPLINNQILSKRISDAHSKLKTTQSDLQTKVENQHFNGLDAIITVVLPGGLLYAAVKHNSHLQERKRLKLITQEINQLSGDLLTFQSAANNLSIAAIQ